MNDDATLVELSKSGDQGAFAQLYERYFDRVYDFLARMVHDSSEAADLTQDAFLRAMNSLNTLTKGTSFKSWLFTIARNTALNRLERASRTQPLEGTNDAGEEQSYDVIDQDRFGNPEEAAEASSLASVVWEAAAALDPKYRSVLLLNLREGLDSAEIADVMGVTKNHAYVLVNRMKSALESAVGAVALFRNGRRHCAELDSVIEHLQIAELSPDARRVIERHAGSCEMCQEQRRKLASPFAIIGGLALVHPAPGIKEAIFGGLQEAFAALAPSGAEASGATQGAGTPGSDTAGPWSTQATRHGASAPGPANGAPPGGPVPTGPTESGGGWSNRRFAMLAGATAVLLLIGGPLAALSFFGGDDGRVELAVVQETPAPLATSSPAATRTPTQVVPTVVKPTETPTPTPSPGAPTAIEDEHEPGLVPGGGEPPTEEPPAPVPAQPGPEQPDIGTDPDSGDDPPAPGTNLLPPAPDPDPPAPCNYAMGASPAELAFDGSTPGKTFVLTGEGCGAPLDVTMEPGSSWIIVTPGAGSIPIGGSLTVTVFADIEDSTADTGRVRVTSLAGAFDILIHIEPLPAPCTPSLQATPSELVFDGSTRSQAFVLEAEGCGEPLEYTVQPDATWIQVNPRTGSIPEGGAVTIVVTINLDPFIATTGRVEVTSAAGTTEVLIRTEPPSPPVRGPGDLTSP